MPIAGSKERTILACLIARVGRVVPVDDLIEELWGDRPPRNPEKALVSYVSRLRRALRPGRLSDTVPELIFFRGDGYVLEADGHLVDAIGSSSSPVRATDSSLRDVPVKPILFSKKRSDCGEAPPTRATGIRGSARRKATGSTSFDEPPPRTSSTRGSQVWIRASSSPSSRPWFERNRSGSGVGAS